MSERRVGIPMVFSGSREGYLNLQPHQHSTESDAFGRPGKLVEQAKKEGVHFFAITDHDTMYGGDKGWNYAQQHNLENITYRQDHFQVIVGLEASTKEGHLLVLGVKEQIPSNLHAQETAERAIDQDAVVIVPHPDYKHADGMSWELTHDLAAKGLVHGVEVYNGAEQSLRYMAYIAENFPLIGQWLSNRLAPEEDINLKAIREYMRTGGDQFAAIGGHDGHLKKNFKKVSTLVPEGMDVFDAIRGKQTLVATEFQPEFWGLRMYLHQEILTRKHASNRINNRNGIIFIA